MIKLLSQPPLLTAQLPPSSPTSLPTYDNCSSIDTLTRIQAKKIAYLGIHCKMALWPELLGGLPARCTRPRRRRHRIGRLRGRIKRDRGEVLKEANDDEGHFVVCKLRQYPISTHAIADRRPSGGTKCTCCPRQIRGPALKGTNMYGFGVRYFRTRSSRNLSGSNSSADVQLLCKLLCHGER